MQLNRVGFVGWRGMVGSVLMQRMAEEQDFSLIDAPRFFSTSQAGQPGPTFGGAAGALADAHDLDALADMDIIITCQGGDYTAEVHPRLRARGWRGYWIDAASTLRMAEDATVILDPVNRPIIDDALARGERDFIGGNCTTGLMMMALAGLFNADLIEWIAVTTYQAISGGGARQMRELLAQLGCLHRAAEPHLANSGGAILAMETAVTEALRGGEFPQAEIGAPLGGSLLPWIDRAVAEGRSREEWKGAAETNKVLGRTAAPIPVESTCVRVGVLRCHSQGFTLKLKGDPPLDELTDLIATAHEWVSVVPNTREATLAQLTPAAVSGTLNIAIGRLRTLSFGRGYLGAFTVGDQLLWGAAEPLRRMLRILAER